MERNLFSVDTSRPAVAFQILWVVLALVAGLLLGGLLELIL